MVNMMVKKQPICLFTTVAVDKPAKNNYID